MLLKPFTKLIPSALLLLLVLWLRPYVLSLDPSVVKLFVFTPYVLSVISGLLSAYYNRAKLFVISLLVFVSYCLVQSYLQTSLNDQGALSVYTLLSLAIPIMLMLLNILPERGLRNRFGVCLVLLVLVHFVLTFAVHKLFPEWVGGLHGLFLAKPFPAYILSIGSSLIFLLSLLLGLYYLCRYGSENAAAIISILIFHYIVLVCFDVDYISVTIYTAMGTSLVMYLISSSYNMAFRDELTGLKGRRALNETLKGLSGRYTIAMLDVDRFKKLNDQYGHDVGDHVLKMVATQIGNVKGGGSAYRYGGEEFCVVFSGKSLDQCLSHLEGIRSSIESYQLSLRDIVHRPKSSEQGQKKRGSKKATAFVAVTISIGVAERNEALSDPALVLKAADEALYMAKKKGRNRIAC